MSETVASLPRTRRTGLFLSRRLLAAPVVALSAALVYAILTDHTAVFDPPWLLTSLNLVFQTIVPLLGAALAVRAYRRTGVGAILAIGTGLLAVGLGGGLVPAVLRFWVEPNAGVTMHNVAVLVAGVCQLVAATAAILAVSLGPRRVRHVVLAYGLVATALAVWLVLVLANVPPTFVTSAGPSPVRQVVLGTAAGLFLLSAFGWWQTAVRDRSIRFLDWYVPGLALYSIALAGLLDQGQSATLVVWVSRFGLYLGAGYMFVGVARETLQGRPSRPDAALGIALLQAGIPFRPLVESTTEAVIALGARGRVAYWNDAARRMFGYDASEAFDQDPLLLIAPGASPARKALAELLGDASASSRGRRELILAGRGRVELPADVEVFANQKDPRLTILVITDVTERVKAREELQDRVRERTAELERANRAKDEFLGLVSHELKTPVTSIVAAAALLERRLLGVDDAGMLADLTAEASRLSRIIDNLLALARLDAGKPVEREPVALDRLAGTVVGEVRREFRDRVVRVTTAPGVIVEASTDQLGMVVRNLVVNALKYSPTDTDVDVVVHPDGDLACIDVIDAGVGISEDDPMRLFEPFFRSAATEATPGVGIGLTVCRRIVESFGGRVRADRRRDGPGSIFAFQLPLVTSDVEPTISPPAIGEIRATATAGRDA